MDRQRVKDLFRRMQADDTEAGQQLSEYLREWKAQQSEAAARNELTGIVYDICYEYVQRRMRHEFRFLLDRHSAASVLHAAWVRTLGPSTVPLDDLPTLCLRIGSMTSYVLLDAVRRQLRWDRDGTTGGDETPADALGSFEDSGSWDPAGLAVWTGFHEQVATLPDDQRKVFTLHYYLEMSRRTIADQLDLSENR